MTTHSDERTSTYEVRAEPPTRHGRPALRTGLADGVLLLAGLYLILSPWVIASPWAIFHGAGMVPMDIPAATALSTATWLSNVIAGAVVLLAGLGRTRS